MTKLLEQAFTKIQALPDDTQTPLPPVCWQSWQMNWNGMRNLPAHRMPNGTVWQSKYEKKLQRDKQSH